MATDPLPPVHPDDDYYLTEPTDEELWFEDDLLADDLQWWDAEVDYQWETR